MGTVNQPTLTLTLPFGLFHSNLQEAAADNILSETRFKLLNIGLFTAGAGHLLILGPRFGDSATAGPLLPLILGTWGVAALLGAVNLLQSSKRRGE